MNRCTLALTTVVVGFSAAMSAQVAPPDGDLVNALAKASAYVAAHEARFSLLVSEERSGRPWRPSAA